MVEGLREFVETNFALMFAASLAWVVAWAAFFAWLRYRSGPRYPEFSKGDILKWILPPNFNDLEHYVPRKDILGVETSSSFGRKTLVVRFRAADAAERAVELILRKPTDFRAALGR